jgi:hypothetical protein
MSTLLVDIVTEDPLNDEFVLYLVENGPWTNPLEDRLRVIQTRLYVSLDAVVDGHLASKYPNSRARKIRIQVDCHNSPPESVMEFIRKFSSYFENDTEMQQAIAGSSFVRSIRIVNAVDIGRNIK